MMFSKLEVELIYHLLEDEFKIFTKFDGGKEVPVSYWTNRERLRPMYEKCTKLSWRGDVKFDKKERDWIIKRIDKAYKDCDGPCRLNNEHIKGEIEWVNEDYNSEQVGSHLRKKYHYRDLDNVIGIRDKSILVTLVRRQMHTEEREIVLDMLKKLKEKFQNTVDDE